MNQTAKGPVTRAQTRAAQLTAAQNADDLQNGVITRSRSRARAQTANSTVTENAETVNKSSLAKSTITPSASTPPPPPPPPHPPIPQSVSSSINSPSDDKNMADSQSESQTPTVIDASPPPPQPPLPPPPPPPPPPPLSHSHQESETNPLPATSSNSNPNVDENDDVTYQFSEISSPTSIFKKECGSVFKGRNEETSNDLAIEMFRLEKSLMAFLKSIRGRYPTGIKFHVSIKTVFHVIKQNILVDTPAYYFTSRSRLLLVGDDDDYLLEIIKEICDNLRKQSVDLLSRGSSFQFFEIDFCQVSICSFRPATFGKVKMRSSLTERNPRK